ncbi:MAG TPA: hypothetical protein VNN55_01735 [bacterium]|nr:hypothetical protein [bacterium]
MRCRDLFSYLAGTALVLTTVLAYGAAAPSKLSYQAVLQTASGDPVTAPVSVTFTIYDAGSGGNAVWTETRTVTPDAAGRVSVLLGDNTPIADAVFAGADRWLGIRVGADPEMSPRTQLAASAYSRRVSTVDGSTGGTMEGNLTLRSTAAFDKDAEAAQAAQLTLVSLAGDTIIVGPADQLVFRATDASGTELMSATVSGPNGPTLGIRDQGGNISQSSATSTRWSTGAGTKDINAMQLRAEAGRDGYVIYGTGPDDTVLSLYSGAEGGQLEMFDFSTAKAASTSRGFFSAKGFRIRDLATGTDLFEYNPLSGLVVRKAGTAEVLTSVNPNTGLVSTTSINVSARALNPNKDVQACGDGNPSDLGPITSENNAVGPDNNLSTAISSFAVGECNTITATTSTAFGKNNTLSADNTVAIGEDNLVGSQRSSAIGYSNSVYGGNANVAFGTDHFLEGAGDCAILGGSADSIRFANNTVVSGRFNLVVDSGGGAFHCVIGGGYLNTIRLTDDPEPNPGAATIGGGSQHLVTRTFATVGGGQANRVTARLGTIAGGVDCAVTGEGGFVGGGSWSLAEGPFSVVCGGGETGNSVERNMARGLAAAVVGGRRNIADGDFAAIPGGNANEAPGDYAMASGRRAKANHDGSFVWADHSDADFSSSGMDQFLIRASGNVGINTNTPTSALHVNGPIATHVATFAGSATLSSANSVALVSSTPATITIPAASTCPGRQITVKKIDGGPGAVTVLSAGGTIDGAIIYSLSASNKYVTVVSDGANWFVIANN